MCDEKENKNKNSIPLIKESKKKLTNAELKKESENASKKLMEIRNKIFKDKQS